MEKQLKLFFEFLENDKKLSNNTLQSYKRDLKQFRRYIEGCEVAYNKVDEEVMHNYIEYLEELGKKPSTISRCIASIRSFYQYVLKKGKVKKHTIQKGQEEVCLGTGFFQKNPVPKQKLTAFVYCKYCQNMVVLISNKR